MADFGIYWPYYAKDRKSRRGLPGMRWQTSRKWLANRVKPGDRLWFYTSGAICEMEHKQQGYLVLVTTLHHTKANSQAEKDDGFWGNFSLVTDEARFFHMQPPLLVDGAIRQPDRDVEEPIGQLRQTPIEMTAAMAEKLLDRLRVERPKDFEIMSRW